ncbi:DUF6270 domain-containing protein [Arthrobacter sp. TMN-50]
MISSLFEQCDHLAWKTPVHEWESLGNFLSAEKWADGIHSIMFKDAPHLDLLMSGISKLNGDGLAIPVFFNGAVTSRQSSNPPFFSGMRIAAKNGMPFVTISDPSLNLDRSLGLAWYAGNRHTLTQDVIEKILLRLHHMTGLEILLVGGSGGGFAALHFAHKMGSKASAFVWNPQTNILEYNEKFVKNYLKIAMSVSQDVDFEALNWKTAALSHFGCNGIELNVCDRPANTRPRRLVYLQNSDDWHVQTHMMPYLESSEFSFDQPGRYGQTDFRQILVAQFGSGHSPPEPEVVSLIIDLLRDPAVTAKAAVDSLLESKILGPQQRGVLPRDLRNITQRIRECVSFAVTQQGSSFSLTVALGIVPIGYGGLNIEFFAVSDGHKKRLRMAETSPTFQYESTEPEARIDKFGAVVRDGFGYQLMTLESSVSSAVPTRVILLGSSTTQEAISEPNKIEVVQYVTRSSLASIFQKPLPMIMELIEGNSQTRPISEFQKNILRCDVTKLVPELLKSADFDMLLVDLIDERIPLLEVNGSYITNSPEFRAIGLELSGVSEVEPGGTVHLDFFKTGVNSLVDLIGERRIVVNKLFWARRDTSGQYLPNQQEIDRNNIILSKLYDVFESFEGVQYINYPDGLLVAEENHKWGATPYRYGPNVRKHLLASIPPLLCKSATTDQRI